MSNAAYRAFKQAAIGATANERYHRENHSPRRRVAFSRVPCKKSGFSLNDPLVKFAAAGGILLIGSGLLMKTYRKYFPSDSDIADGLIDDTKKSVGDKINEIGDDVSEVTGDITEEIGETLATVPYRFLHGVYGVASIAAADVYRAFLAAGNSAEEAGRLTQEWIDSQVAAAGDAAKNAAKNAVKETANVFLDWLLGRDSVVADPDFEFGGGSVDPDSGFGGGWSDDDYVEEPGDGFGGWTPEYAAEIAAGYAAYLAAIAAGGTGDGTGNDGLVPSGGPGTPDYSDPVPDCVGELITHISAGSWGRSAYGPDWHGKTTGGFGDLLSGKGSPYCVTRAAYNSVANRYQAELDALGSVTVMP